MTRNKKLIWLAGLVCVAHTILYFSFYFLAAKKNELVLRSSEYKKKAGKYDVLFVGDSHMERSVDMSEMGDRTFSVTYYGENNVMNYYRLKYYLENNSARPKYVILPCDIVTFAKGYNLHRTNSFFYYSFIPFSELKHFENNKLSAYYKFFKVTIFPYSEWQYGLNLADAGRTLQDKIRFSERTKEEKEKNARHFVEDELMCAGNKNNLFFNTALDYLEKTISLCKKHGVKLVFVKFPVTSELMDEIRFHVDSQYVFHRPSEKLIQAHGLPILDLENIFINKRELFFDCHHLNIYGKKMFTQVLKQKLDSLLKVY